jgi:hypothetical protein
MRVFVEREVRRIDVGGRKLQEARANLVMMISFMPRAPR